MPVQDHHHPIVRRALLKAGWTIVREQFFVAVGTSAEITRRLYVDLQVQSAAGKAVLIEIKGFTGSPTHELMELIGQFLVYRAALDYLDDATPLYVAIPVAAYNTTIKHVLAQTVINTMLKTPIPFVLYDPSLEELVQWIPPL